MKALKIKSIIGLISSQLIIVFAAYTLVTKGADYASPLFAAGAISFLASLATFLLVMIKSSKKLSA